MFVDAVPPSYKGFRYPGEVIAHCVWLYHRFPLSFREVEELMLERGVTVSYETVRQWCAKFGQAYPGYAARHRMRAGITGLAQVTGLRGDTSIEDRARFDNAYIDNWSLWQDFCLLVRTAAALVRPTGS